jgi:predicted amidohydrolase YtcJ
MIAENSQSSPASPSLIFTHAKVFTSNPAQPHAEAVAVTGNRVLAVGNTQDLLALKRPGTRLIDAQGCTLMPSFIDCHVHLYIGSAELDNVFLDAVLTLEDLRTTLHKHIQAHPDVEWVCGSHMKYSILPGNEPLTRYHLDGIMADIPIVLMAYDYHTLWANTKALELGGILHGFDPGPTGVVVMGSDNLASGELREAAAYQPVLLHAGTWGRVTAELTSSHSSPPTQQADLHMIKKGLAFLARHGITSLHNMDGNLAQLALYSSLEESGDLTVRLSVPYSVSPTTPASEIEEASQLQSSYHSDFLRFEAVKFFMDGVIESCTAYLLEDYADAPLQQGHSYYTPEQFNELGSLCDRLGLQIRVHAIGDASIRQTLDGFGAIRRVNGPRDHRHRIEHIELLHPSDIPRFAQLGVIASMQPLHLAGVTFENDVWLNRVGESRWDRGFSWRSLRKAGTHLAFGSDWPVVSPNPMLGLDRAINRKSWLPGLAPQSQELAECLVSYTREAAFAEFQEHQKGQLRPGFLADLVLLSANLESIPSEEISSVVPVITICNGHITYES